MLGVEKKFPISKEVIKKHYREKAKENHPDVTGSDEKMKEINAAYEWLDSNIEKVNEANAEGGNNGFSSTDEFLRTFSQYYLAEKDIKQRERAVDALIKYIENYQLERKLAMFRQAFKK